MEPKDIQTSGLSPILSQYDSVGGPQLAESRPPQLFISGLIPAKCVFISQNKLRTSTCSDTIVPAPKGLRYNTFSHLHFPIPLTLLKKHFIFSCVFRKLTRLLWIHQSKVILFIYTNVSDYFSSDRSDSALLKSQMKNCFSGPSLITQGFDLTLHLQNICMVGKKKKKSLKKRYNSLQTQGLLGVFSARSKTSPTNVISNENSGKYTDLHTHGKYTNLHTLKICSLKGLAQTTPLVDFEWSPQLIKVLILHYLWWLKCI